MDETLRKFVDAFLIFTAIIAGAAVCYRVADCNEYEARLTGISSVGVEILCADPPCVERVDPEAKQK